MPFDWHADPITANTPLDPHYRTTQNVRRFLAEHCGAEVKLSRDFMAWIRSGVPQTMGDVAREWRLRHGQH